MSIRTKILIPMVAMAMVCALTSCLIAIVVVKLFTSDFNDKQLFQTKTLAESLLGQHTEDAERLSAMVAGDDQLMERMVDYLAGGDRQPMVNSAVSLLSATGADFLTVLDAEGNVLVRAHEPDNYGDSLASQTNVQTAMGGSQYTTIEKGSAVKLSVRSGTPVYDTDGTLIGVISLGYRLDQNGFVDYLKKMTGTEATVYLGDTRVSTTILDGSGNRAIDTAAPEEISKEVLAGNEYIGRTDESGTNLYACYVPIRDAENTVLGMLFVGLDTSETDDRLTRDIWMTLAFLVVISILSGLVSVTVSSRIVRPISEMSLAAKRLAEGDVDVTISIQAQSGSKDESVHLAMALSDMIQSNRERAKLISAVAGGDLSGQIAPRSAKDVVGIALTELLEKNNTAFGEMNLTAAQLDAASEQMSDGAQSLSQGATEQAATVEHLNLKLKELSDKTVEEAKSAKEAAHLSESVKAFAEKGKHQMDQMMDAVEQISKASEAIEKVIKVIDDIAFQTNILALNASVEAARAGQHGKGFAVVAGEVRNLAAKSADAAKDTSTLIANSIDKAKLGAQISNDTAASFAEIVEGITNSSVIVEAIAGFMQAQKAEIESIVDGVEQIGTVISSVSASAEESASASQEMSSQAAHMAATLSLYKLRDGSNRMSLPPKH